MLDSLILYRHDGPAWEFTWQPTVQDHQGRVQNLPGWYCRQRKYLYRIFFEDSEHIPGVWVGRLLADSMGWVNAKWEARPRRLDTSWGSWMFGKPLIPPYEGFKRNLKRERSPHERRR
jgi:hypothetical protein